MTTRYLSVCLPRLPTDRIERIRHAGISSRDVPSGPPPGGPPPGGPPPDGLAGEASLARDALTGLVTVCKVKGAQRIAAVDAAASRLAIRPGMALADARAMAPALQVFDADPAAEAALLIRIVDWCGRFTPLAAADGPDGVLLDIGGAAHLFGGEAGLLDAVEDGLRAQGFGARGAIASTPEAAWALARFDARLRRAPVRIAPALADADFERMVADLGVAALRLDEETLRSMAQAGLHRIGDLMLRPRAPITARFGPLPFARLDGVLGRTKSPISPRFDAAPYLAERRFASGIAQRSDVEAALLPLARHLCGLLARHREGARRIQATFFRVDGAVKRINVGTSRPTRDPDTVFRLLRERIESLGEDGLDTGYGFDLIRLGVTEAETLDPAQDELLSEKESFDGDLAALADRLGARIGLRRVLRFEDHGTHIPEFAVVAVPAASRQAPDRSLDSDHDDVPCRPIRLFDRPEPIVTLAAVPDGPPVRFRWRRVTHEIAAIEGPERISPEWWRGHDGLTRDYFRAEDREGRRFWLFREGLLNHETTQSRWYLHGLFG